MTFDPTQRSLHAHRGEDGTREYACWYFSAYGMTSLLFICFLHHAMQYSMHHSGIGLYVNRDSHEQFSHLRPLQLYLRVQIQCMIVLCSLEILTVVQNIAVYSCIFTAGSASSLQYFTLTSPTFLLRVLDGASDPISTPGFPFGSQIFFTIFVR